MTLLSLKIGILATLKLGAEKCVGYDIDEWSVENTKHNAIINGVDYKLTSLLGDSAVLGNVTETFNLIMSNINRNILLADMAAFRKKMAAHALLILSGFYHSDAPLLVEKASSLGLIKMGEKHQDNWTCLLFQAND